MLFGIAGLLLAIAVPVGIDVLDPRVFSPADAVRVGGIPLLGWLPDRKAFGETYWNERVMRVAHRIYRDSTSNHTRVWCFTSAQGKSGTTTLVQEIGKALSSLGSSVLTVEADPRSSTGGKGGLSRVLEGQSSLADEVQRTGASTPDRLPAGAGDGSGRLPDLHRIVHVLGDAARSYDVVLVDLPTISASVEAEYLTSHADAVVLVNRAGGSGGVLRRALKLLERNKPKAVALVLNSVPRNISVGVERDFAEFTDGAAPAEPGWKTPWLWR
jgi:Mrp family chromosome partitioning ATPase